jgi:hypothetical protein
MAGGRLQEADAAWRHWDWSANMLRSGYRENAIVDGGGYSFRVVRTLNVQ